MKNNILIGAGAVVLMALFLIFFNSPEKNHNLQTEGEQIVQSQELTLVKIGVFPGSPNAHFPVYVAQQEGIFANHGLEVEIVELFPGLSVAALLSGELDYGQYLREVVSAALEDAPVKVVAVYPHEPAFAVIANDDIEYSDVTKVAAKFANDATHYHALELVAREDIKAEVTTSNALTLLADGQTDIAVTNLADPYLADGGNFTVVEILNSDIVSGFTTRTETVENNPEQVAAVIKAREEALQFILENPEKAQQYLLTVMELEANEENKSAVENIYTAMMKRPTTPLNPNESVEALIKIANAGAYESFGQIDEQTVEAEEVEKAFDFNAYELAHESQ